MNPVWATPEEQAELDRLHLLGTVRQPRNKRELLSSTSNTESYELTSCTREDIYDSDTGEVVFAQYCDNARCSRCAQRQCQRIARLAAWSVQNAPHIYLMTLTPMSAQQWSTVRKAYLRAARAATGGQVEMFSVVERGNLEHVHALVWSERPLKEVSSVPVQVKPIERTYMSVYNTMLYLLKTVVKDNNLEQHFNLNSGRLIAKTDGAYRGFKSFAEVRSAYRAQEGWRRGSAPSEPVTTHDAFEQRRTVSKPVRNGVRAAARRHADSPEWAEMLSENGCELYQPPVPTNSVNRPGKRGRAVARYGLQDT